MEHWIEEPKVVENGEERHVIVHINELPAPIICVHAHSHSYVEMLYCLSGTHEIQLNWKSYTFSVGDMVLINAREIHQIRAVTPGVSRYIVVRFEPELLYNNTHLNAFEIKYILPLIMREISLQKVFSAEEIKDTFLPEAFLEIWEDYSKQTYCYEFALHTNICRIFLWILRHWHQNGVKLNISSEDENVIKQFKPVMEYMRNHYDQEITALDMAELSHMSYSYFSRMFKRIMKQSFREYLNFIRIEKSELLLVTTQLSITDIAMQVGFSSSSYFIQQFKLHKKISPRQFRKKFIDTEKTTLPSV